MTNSYSGGCLVLILGRNDAICGTEWWCMHPKGRREPGQNKTDYGLVTPTYISIIHHTHAYLYHLMARYIVIENKFCWCTQPSTAYWCLGPMPLSVSPSSFIQAIVNMILFMKTRASGVVESSDSGRILDWGHEELEAYHLVVWSRVWHWFTGSTTSSRRF